MAEDQSTGRLQRAPTGGKGGAPGPPPAAKGKGPGPPPPLLSGSLSAQQPPAKAAGAAPGPPPPRPPPAEGKGAAPGPPPPRLPTAGGKGAGKGAATAAPGPPPPPGGSDAARRPHDRAPEAAKKATISPPAHLVAPQGAPTIRVQKRLLGERAAEGTLWEGLGMWGPDQLLGRPALDLTVVNVDALREQWSLSLQPRDVTQAQTQSVRSQRTLPGSVLFCVEVTSFRQNFTPELVRRALTEDMDALSSEQAEALSKLAPYVDQFGVDLRNLVPVRGQDAFVPAELLIWNIACIPEGANRARLLADRVKIPSEVCRVERQVADLELAAKSLWESKPLRSILQTILAVRNILSQEGSPGFSISSLQNLKNERVLPALAPDATSRSPSVLSMVVSMLEATQGARCRLRLLRILWIGRMLPTEQTASLVWSFLGDDLRASPWDALPLLQECWRTCTLMSYEMLSELHSLESVARTLASRDFGAAGTSDVWKDQLAEFRAATATAVDTVRSCRSRFSSAGSKLARLVGEVQGPSSVQPNSRQWQATEHALKHLHILGRDLTQEREVLRKARMQQRARSLAQQTDGPVRSWPAVDTSAHLLAYTTDPDLVRSLKLSSAGPSTDANRTAVAKAKEAGAAIEAKKQAQAKAKANQDLLHGSGPEGSYKRCPTTGRWVNSLRG
eukprot:gnl/TRDRNA2_/TRDRNA2_174770_c5_seq1.p1 gnl/TRDRNA2_/TRDRNA2_174770_c5~~gnl/TRDRNA2_/TRDRNA2_174770_c5_seq1.p1  ORF type:complete len:685 (+),score=109.58 gnl/TRDRNA2_/TRDRNA2_174770_c5_seq1:32-2056(+)